MDDRSRVDELLGRPAQGDFDVVVRDRSGDPVVLRNAPLLDDGTPMPTRFYLVGPALVRAVSRLEAGGGVRRAAEAVDAEAIARTHARYAAERDAALPSGHRGPRPTGGVGGTRTGVKCLHAHVAHRLAGGEDPVGDWAIARLAEDPDGATALAELDDGDGAETPPGWLVVDIDDDVVTISMSGGGRWRLPFGAVSLHRAKLAEHDPPRPEDLTNALGFALDHLDDVIREAPSVLAAPGVAIAGRHAVALGQLEVGAFELPDGYRLRRADADEVFRTIVAEPTAERGANPGLADDHVATVVATCCIVLTVMRRLELDQVDVTSGTDASASFGAGSGRTQTPTAGSIGAGSGRTQTPTAGSIGAGSGRTQTPTAGSIGAGSGRTQGDR